MIRSARRPPVRRNVWALLVVLAAVGAVAGTALAEGGPIDWFSQFTVTPTVAYSGDVNVTLSATVVGLAGPIGGILVHFVAYSVPGEPAVTLRSSVTDRHGVAVAQFIPRAALTLRLFAEFQVPGTSHTVPSAPVTLQVFAAPTL